MGDGTLMKFYATKWVLTKGIIVFEGEIKEGPSFSNFHYAVCALQVRGWNQSFLRIGKDAFDNLEAAKLNALERARKNVEAKKKGLKKSEQTLAKFEKGFFSIKVNGEPKA
jgi:hypothetical protein